MQKSGAGHGKVFSARPFMRGIIGGPARKRGGGVATFFRAGGRARRPSRSPRPAPCRSTFSLDRSTARPFAPVTSSRRHLLLTARPVRPLRSVRCPSRPRPSRPSSSTMSRCLGNPPGPALNRHDKIFFLAGIFPPRSTTIGRGVLCMPFVSICPVVSRCVLMLFRPSVSEKQKVRLTLDFIG